MQMIKKAEIYNLRYFKLLILINLIIKHFTQ